jgi:hypothetical protein
LKALEDESNEALFNFTSKKLREMTLSVLKELNLSKPELLEMMRKLKEYKYVDEMSDLKYGTYLRWIPIDDPENVHLTKGALFCEVKITDNGVFLVCKNYGQIKKHFCLSMDKNLIFQKLTDQELVLLSALDHLSTKSVYLRLSQRSTHLLSRMSTTLIELETHGCSLFTPPQVFFLSGRSALMSQDWTAGRTRVKEKHG